MWNPPLKAQMTWGIPEYKERADRIKLLYTAL